MRLFRCLVALSCVCLLAIPAQATDLVCDFDGNCLTPYSAYGTGGGLVMHNGPPGCQDYYRLCTAGSGDQINCIAFDATTQVASRFIQIDFDYRIGGTPDNGDPNNHADGMGFVLLNTDVYGNTGPGPDITEEAQSIPTAPDESLGFGLDTWNNGLPYDPDNNHISFKYFGGPPGGSSILLATSLTPYGYNLHRGEPPEPPFDDTMTPFDHFHATIDYANVTFVTVTITANSTPGVTLFSPIQELRIPGAQPQKVRVAFGARTGASTDNHDLCNVNIHFFPP